MIDKVRSKIKKFGYKLRYGKKFSCKSFSVGKNSGVLCLKGGKISAKSIKMMTNSVISCVGGDVEIGSVALNRNCTIVSRSSIKIGDGVIVGPNVCIYDHDHKFGADGVEDGYNTAEVVIGDNCWIGAGVTVLRGTKIGEGCVIGAGTVLKGEIPPRSLVTSGRETTIKKLEER